MKENIFKVNKRQNHLKGLQLKNGSRIGVIGGGPAGSLFSYFIMELASRIDLALNVDIYEPRDFTVPGPRGCNMCGGIISETLIQNLAAEGINFTSGVIQRGIDSYVMHFDVGQATIKTPLNEMRIGSVFRGAGPRDVEVSNWKGFDAYLLYLAVNKGVQILPDKVEEVGLGDDGKVIIKAFKGNEQVYDLIVVASGVNTTILKIFEGLGIGYKLPKVTKTLIREYRLGREAISKSLGSAMHVFLLDIAGLKFAAIIPKGDYITVAMLGENIDTSIADIFMSTPAVRSCMPREWNSGKPSCQCLPYINVRGVEIPFADRFIFIGDAGVTRLYKDGIGAAYRTAKAAARVAVFEGISGESFRRHYLPVCQRITMDNRIGSLAFEFTGVIQKKKFLRRALLHMIVGEQVKPAKERRLSSVMWDMFSGSAPYRDIFERMIHPNFILRFLWSIVASNWMVHKNINNEV